MFDRNGKFLFKFGSKGARNGQTKFPVGVGLLSNGNIVVSEDGGNRLQIGDSEGNFLRVVGARQFKNPEHLFVELDDNILVADWGNDRIQVFHQNGNHIKSIGTGQDSSPVGVCMDREGRIIVSEYNLHRISIFLEHLFLFSFIELFFVCWHIIVIDKRTEVQSCSL